MPATRRISHTVDGATVTPSLISSPWIRRCPHRGFSRARRTTRRAMLGTVGGRPGLRRLLVSYLLPASLRCQARSVAGVTGKISVQRLRGRSRASAASHTRSAGSYRTRLACRRSTAFSCRSTSSSASLARSPRNTRTARPSTGTSADRRSLAAPRKPTITTSSLLAIAQVSHPIEYSSGTGYRRPRIRYPAQGSIR